MSTQLDGAIDDRINIALAFDSGYAMPAAVTLRSIAENVKGPVTLYVFDCGLNAEDRQKIDASLPYRSDIILIFVDLPADAVASNLPAGPAWARIDMMRCLPVQRILYLDADTLVRKDLRELWNTDLGGHAIAAAPDVVLPMGHAGVPRGDYFNSGVLLIDIAKTRSTLRELEALCYEMKDAMLHDQDPLNVHFRGNRLWLSLTWNAQGLGTCEKFANTDKICLEELKDPAIVHFIGPVHPQFAIVLDPYVQPYTAKPWGYAGAPGHPYGQEWWDMLEKTAWKGWRETTECKEIREQARRKALKNAKDAFDRWEK